MTRVIRYNGLEPGKLTAFATGKLFAVLPMVISGAPSYVVGLWIATIAFEFTVPNVVGEATHYHADYVLPYWAKKKRREQRKAYEEWTAKRTLLAQKKENARDAVRVAHRAWVACSTPSS